MIVSRSAPPRNHITGGAHFSHKNRSLGAADRSLQVLCQNRRWCLMRLNDMEKQPTCQTSTPHSSAHALCLYQKSGRSLIRLPHTSAASRPILVRDITFMCPANSGDKRKDWCDPERVCFYFRDVLPWEVRALEIFLKSSRQRSSNEM